VKTVLFQREFLRFQGGHLKVWHYFNHVASAPGFEAIVRFRPDTVWDDSNPWHPLREAGLAWTDPVAPDILFVAGRDWRWLEPGSRAESQLPVINLLQGVLHASPDDPLERHRFLPNKAIRICSSSEIARAITDTGRVRGPVFTIPNGIDIAEMDAVPRPAERDIDLLIVAAKQPPLGRRLAERLAAPGREIVLLRRYEPRPALLALMAGARVTLLLPNPLEGFYMPALEGMALRTVVVCPDCVGNRSYCEDGGNCFMPAFEDDAIVSATERALAPARAHEDMMRAARATVDDHSLEGERDALLRILDRIDDLWETA
jgi:hypothetical protein